MKPELTKNFSKALCELLGLDTSKVEDSFSIDLSPNEVLKINMSVFLSAEDIEAVGKIMRSPGEQKPKESFEVYEDYVIPSFDSFRHTYSIRNSSNGGFNYYKDHYTIPDGDLKGLYRIFTGLLEENNLLKRLYQNKLKG